MKKVALALAGLLLSVIAHGEPKESYIRLNLHDQFPSFMFTTDYCVKYQVTNGKKDSKVKPREHLLYDKYSLSAGTIEPKTFASFYTKSSAIRLINSFRKRSEEEASIYLRIQRVSASGERETIHSFVDDAHPYMKKLKKMQAACS